MLIVDKNFAASVGGNASFNKSEYDFESSLECWKPGWLQDRSYSIAVKRLTQFLRQNTTLD